MLRCLIIEDETETSRYIAAGLGAGNYETVAVETEGDGFRLASEQRWDAIILDRMLPENTDGLGLLARLRQSGNTTPVLILSALSALDERVRGLRDGGDDYLTKPFALAELRARLDALVRRSSLRGPEGVVTIGDLVLNSVTRSVERAGTPITLQPREFHLLEFLIRHRDQVVTRAMLLESVWNYRFEPQTGVIDVMISRLRQKIDRGFDRPLIHTVRGVGYVIRE